ncbi:Lipid phosphate phosphohydrolase 3, related [Eimeria mitis]|uniref:Lipid phosphate phosphohydrolase 3, related n=1 Tax=Eimeria mitis TaxID=44415 RepID=U6JPL4_9EIME|nr:Lipid phosphate phosphohydrolase 3, related [Eimeria mitis]CDJ27384.1 Lipid phosphate phosphohydrolase 3, related [Eimeria mitis]
MDASESVCTRASADVESGSARGGRGPQLGACGGPPSVAVATAAALSTVCSSSSSSSSSSSQQHRAKPPYLARVCVHASSAAALTIWALVLLIKLPVERGTFCSDKSIALPYMSGSVSSPSLFVICLVFPALIMILVELLLAAVRATQETEKKGREQRVVILMDRRVPEIMQQLYMYVGGLALSVASVFLLTNALKAAVGSLRPHFLSVCKPDWSRVQCTDSSGRREVYVQDFFCTGNATAVEEGRRSFPSGHSSCSSCGLLFVALYLQCRFVWQQQATAPKHHLRQQQTRWGLAVEQLYWVAHAAAPLLQFVLLLIALYVPATRVAEHFHRPIDVLAGMTIGVIGALYGFFFLVNPSRRSLQ